jgi:hypothetical protein
MRAVTPSCTKGRSRARNIVVPIVVALCLGIRLVNHAVVRSAISADLVCSDQLATAIQAGWHGALPIAKADEEHVRMFTPSL